MAKKKGQMAAKARARRDQRNRSPSPNGAAAEEKSSAREVGPIVPVDGRRIHRGLQNLGNTCFMNSILQCLNVSLPFSDALLELLAAGLQGLSGPLCTTFRGIRGLEDSGSGKVKCFTPQSLRQQLIAKFPWYRGKEQHDAHEFLRTLLGSVADDTTEAEEAEAREVAKQADSKARRPPPGSGKCGHCVTESFRGHLCAATLCWRCARVSLRLDPFLDLSLDLPALKGRQVGALGVLPRQEAEIEVGASAATASGATSSRRNASDKANDGRKKANAGRKLMGVWEAAREAAEVEEVREHVRAYIQRVVVRVVLCKEERESAEGARSGDEDHARDAATDNIANDGGTDFVNIEIELTRSKKANASWGFKWTEEAKETDGRFVLGDIAIDSVLDKWNLRCKTKGEGNLVVCVGDVLVEVNSATTKKDIQTNLRCDDRVVLCFIRGGANRQPAKSNCMEEKHCIADSDEEAERREEAKEAAWKDFNESATQCCENLPETLRASFGQASIGRESNGHFHLEDCLRQFSVVEAIEDDYKPVYQCATCKQAPESEEQSASKAIRKTFASRRLWLWPVDLPPIMTLQLKRFRRYQQRFEKSVASVVLPPVLDLADFVLADAQLREFKPHLSAGSDAYEQLVEWRKKNGDQLSLRYELYGICVHQGGSMKSGHYVAYVNGRPSLEQEEWFGISDSKVWSCSRSEVLKAEAYVAFYRRQPTEDSKDEDVEEGSTAKHVEPAPADTAE